MPSNEERRQAAREKLAKQNERRESDARKRKIKAGVISAAVVVVLAAAACYVWVPEGPRAPLRVAAESRFKSQHVNCTFPDRPDQVAAARKSVDDMKTQIAQAKTQLATLNADQKTALQDQITAAEARNNETEKQLPQLQKIAERNKSVSKPDGKDVPNSGTLKGSITTDQGVVGFELDRSKAPCNVETFVTLMQAKYFDNTICHRETASESADKQSGLFVIQCGDPSGTGLGGPNWTSPDETPTFLKAAPNAAPAQAGASPSVVYPAGTIAVANANAPQQGQSNTGSSQFFLVYKDTTLPADYSVIGKTDDAGLTLLQQIAKKGIKVKAGGTPPKPGQPVTDGEPIQPVKITTMALTS